MQVTGALMRRYGKKPTKRTKRTKRSKRTRRSGAVERIMLRSRATKKSLKVQSTATLLFLLKNKGYKKPSKTVRAKFGKTSRKVLAYKVSGRSVTLVSRTSGGKSRKGRKLLRKKISLTLALKKSVVPRTLAAKSGALRRTTKRRTTRRKTSRRGRKGTKRSGHLRRQRTYNKGTHLDWISAFKKKGYKPITASKTTSISFGKRRAVPWLWKKVKGGKVRVVARATRKSRSGKLLFRSLSKTVSGSAAVRLGILSALRYKKAALRRSRKGRKGSKGRKSRRAGRRTVRRAGRRGALRVRRRTVAHLPISEMIRTLKKKGWSTTRKGAKSMKFLKRRAVPLLWKPSTKGRLAILARVDRARKNKAGQRTWNSPKLMRKTISKKLALKHKLVLAATLEKKVGALRRRSRRTLRRRKTVRRSRR